MDVSQNFFQWGKSVHLTDQAIAFAIKVPSTTVLTTSGQYITVMSFLPATTNRRGFDFRLRAHGSSNVNGKALRVLYEVQAYNGTYFDGDYTFATVTGTLTTDVWHQVAIQTWETGSAFSVQIDDFDPVLGVENSGTFLPLSTFDGDDAPYRLQLGSAFALRLLVCCCFC